MSKKIIGQCRGLEDLSFGKKKSISPEISYHTPILPDTLPFLSFDSCPLWQHISPKMCLTSIFSSLMGLCYLSVLILQATDLREASRSRTRSRMKNSQSSGSSSPKTAVLRTWIQRQLFGKGIFQTLTFTARFQIRSESEPGNWDKAESGSRQTVPERMQRKAACPKRSQT